MVAQIRIRFKIRTIPTYTSFRFGLLKKIQEYNRIRSCIQRKKEVNVSEFSVNPLYKMVAQITVRTFEENQVFRVIEGIWLHRKSRQIRIFERKISSFTS